jgi:hypothetical protein
MCAFASITASGKRFQVYPTHARKSGDLASSGGDALLVGAGFVGNSSKYWQSVVLLSFGTNGGGKERRLSQSIPLKKGWALIWDTLSLSFASQRRFRIKSAATGSMLQSLGKESVDFHPRIFRQVLREKMQSSVRLWGKRMAPELFRQVLREKIRGS